MQIAGFEILRTFENTNKVRIPLKGVNKWAGDAALLIADTQLANRFLSWRAGRECAEFLKAEMIKCDNSHYWDCI